MKVSRRTLLEVLGTTAVGSVACTSKTAAVRTLAPPPHNRINLICHGMMLFLYRKTAADLDFFSILIPRPPDIPAAGGTPQHPGHVIKLSEYRAGLQNRLVDPMNPSNYRQGQYELVLEPTPSLFVRGNSQFYPVQGTYPDGTNDLVLYDPSNPQALSLNTDFSYSAPPSMPSLSDKIYFLVKVPYPKQIYSLAKMDFSSGGVPYNPNGNTAMTFKLQKKPMTMGGTHVLSWENVGQQAVLRYFHPNSAKYDDQPLGPSNTAPLQLNLHLYSQPNNWSDDAASVLGLHLQAFDNMVSYTDYNNMPQGQLDLTVNNSTPSNTSVSNPAIDDDLSAEDREDLAYLLTGPKPGMKMEMMLTEPVECLQGYGS